MRLFGTAVFVKVSVLFDCSFANSGFSEIFNNAGHSFRPKFADATNAMYFIPTTIFKNDIVVACTSS